MATTETETAQEAFARYGEQALEVLDTLRRSIAAQSSFDPNRIDWNMAAEMAHVVSMLNVVDEVIP